MMELRPIESSKLPTSNYVKFHCFKSTVDKKGEKNVTEKERERERGAIAQRWLWNTVRLSIPNSFETIRRLDPI